MTPQVYRAPKGGPVGWEGCIGCAKESALDIHT